MSQLESTSLAGPTSISSDDSEHSAGSSNVSAQTAKPEAAPPATTFPPPKTDKPRPHVCATCTRSFARLEHLKRHERSHTKEKPFECGDCKRCFARRDLLLRHQQKLHQSGATPARPRNARRESTSGLPPTSTGRIRKNSVASAVGLPSYVGNPGMRPRANTISHIDPGSLSTLLGSQNVSFAKSGGLHLGHSSHASFSGRHSHNQFDYRAMSAAVSNHGQHHGLTRLNTHMEMGLGGGLRTAPIQGVGHDSFGMNKAFSPSHSTINPNQLHHFNGSLETSQSMFRQFVNPFPTDNPIEEDDFAGWSTGLDESIMFSGSNDMAIDGSSPSAISTASQGGFSEVMLNGSGLSASSSMWHDQMVSQPNMCAAFALDTMGPAFPDLMNSVTTQDLADQGVQNEFYMSSPPALSVMNPSAGIPGMPNQYFQAPMTFNSDTGSISSSSFNGSARHSSVTSNSTDTITESTRKALMYNLTQALGWGHSQRRFSQPHLSSPLSAGGNGKSAGQGASLPSTMDIQRYVNAYIQYFHPHMPFLHIPTLSFDTPAYTYNVRVANGLGEDGMVGGGGCLILAMAAIGALYEFEHSIAKDLFEAAKKLILYYLDERRRAGLSATIHGSGRQNDAMNKPPLWLVQAMLLNLIFGHNCGEQQAAEVASTHCAALVSLAKAAGLDTPMVLESATKSRMHQTSDEDVMMADQGSSRKDSHVDNSIQQDLWIRWKQVEERKRTYFAIFCMSSLLVSAYAHAPRVMNSEIRLDLPCEEDLWSADNAHSWVTKGGPIIAQSVGLSFNAAMTSLLEARTRRSSSRMRSRSFAGNRLNYHVVESDIRPSTLGCYVLINALHVYIWETRQRHIGVAWKAHETEAMHAQIEPALKAWQTAWRANPNHSIERSSTFGPLSADCIPLLDLAYVRLFVNLSRAKEFLWQRDFTNMADELAKGPDVVCQDDGTPKSIDAANSRPTNDDLSNGPLHAGDVLRANVSSKREKLLRKAASYAADSLAMAEKLGATYTEFTAPELPSSSALCILDCAQVLAEWIATVQDRVGRFLGILGKDDIDFTNVPAIMLLEEEDIKLLQKANDMIQYVEMKLAYDLSSNSLSILGSMPNLGCCGYGPKLLMMAAYLLSKAAVWPVTRVQAQALEAHAHHMNQRAEKSVAVP